MDVTDNLLDIHFVETHSRRNSFASRHSCNRITHDEDTDLHIKDLLRSGSVFSSSRFSEDLADEKLADSAEQQDRKLSSHDKDIDGGTAWCCVVGAIITSCLIGGIEKSYGVIFPIIQERFLVSSVQASWIGSMTSTIRFILGVVFGILVKKYGARSITLVGGTFFVVGMIASAYATHAVILFITYGGFLGVGSSLIYMSSTLIINERFVKLRGRANGIAFAGSGLGSFCIPLLMQYLLDEYGYSGEMLIMAGLAANFMISAALFIPLAKKKVESSEALDQSAAGSQDTSSSTRTSRLCDWIKDFCGCGPDEAGLTIGFVLLCGSLSLIFMGYLAALFFLPSLARTKDVSAQSAALLLSVVGISDMMGRLTSGPIFDWQKLVAWKKHMYFFTFLMMAVVNLAFTFCHQYYGFIICAALSGYFAGVCVAQRAVICVDIVGEESLHKFYGLLVSSQGVGVLVGPAIASSLKEYFNNYTSAFYFCGGVQLLAAALLLIDILLHRIKEKRAQETKAREDNSA